MSHDTYELKAEAREQVGKGSARAVRRDGKVPAVIYGDKQPPLAIALSYKDIFYKIHGGGFLTTVATIDVGGKKIQVLPKDYQLDPVRDFPVHVDFLRIGKDTEVNVDVPVHFINEDKSPGIKRGGVLNIVRHEVEFHCPANAIPEFITVDLEGKDIGDFDPHFGGQAAGRRQAGHFGSRFHHRHHRRLVRDEAGSCRADRSRACRRTGCGSSGGRREEVVSVPGGPLRCCFLQVSAIRVRNTPTTGTMSASWRRTLSPAAIPFRPGRRSSRPRSPRAGSAARRWC